MDVRVVGNDWQVKVGADEETSAIFTPASASPSGTLFICAHGAGGHMADKGMSAMTLQLCGRGLDVVRFDFLYRHGKAGRPDPMPRLMECFAAVADHARRELCPDSLILGGRSMGGRAASMLVAEGFACDGLLLLAYPLHPAGQPDKLRDAHLQRIMVPVLCINGTRDPLCRRDLMERSVERLADRWTMRWIDGADHSFHVLKSSGRSDGDVLDEIGDACSAWRSGSRRRAS
jgi:predicted alpha/beta-hydrolase family hydrolase